MKIAGASWARLVRHDEMADPEDSGIAWHLWAVANSHMFPDEMGNGFRYVAAQGKVAERRAEAVHTVGRFLPFTRVDTVNAGYDLLVARFGQATVRRLVGTRLDWDANVYNRSKIGPRSLLMAAWTFSSERIPSFDVGRFDHPHGSRSGWKRL